MTGRTTDTKNRKRASSDAVDSGVGGRNGTAARRSRILEILETQDFVGVKELSEEFGLTEMSIRRDLAAMVGEGLITRVRGGAARPPLGMTSRQYADASSRNAHAKLLIARRAAELLEPGNSVFFYSGSTVARVASNLPESLHSGLTVATNSLPVIEEVSGWRDPHLVAIGGIYLPSYMTFVGPQAVEAVEGINADVAIIGCDGLNAEVGLTTPHQLVAEIGSSIVSQANRTIVVADGTKVGRRGFTPIAPVDRVDVLVTDDSADPSEIAKLRDAGVEVIVV